MNDRIDEMKSCIPTFFLFCLGRDQKRKLNFISGKEARRGQLRPTSLDGVVGAPGVGRLRSVCVSVGVDMGMGRDVCMG